LIVVRNVFRLKFGSAKETTGLWKEGLAIAAREGLSSGSSRLLTDAVGTFYTLVLETTHDSLGDFERSGKRLMENAEWKAWYAKVIPLTEGGYREIFNVVD
jgi:hypothetical protein